jgi:hypothetical protein
VKYRLMPKRPARLLILSSIFLVIVGAERWYRRWRPELTVTTEHYVIYSAASADQTRKIADVVEALHQAYFEVFDGLVDAPAGNPRLKVKLFKDRDQFRRCNRRVGWAEAFYRRPYCYAYYPEDQANPYHWMVHEAAHQLSREVANLDVPRWIDEGIAAYLSTSVVSGGKLVPGEVDDNTYPIWWLVDMKFSGEMEKDIKAGTIIRLQAIVGGKAGPDIDEYFNLYYIHWWSLTHFLLHYEQAKYRDAYFQVIREGGGLKAFERHIGSVEAIQQQWYGYLRGQQQTLNGRLRVPPQSLPDR